MTEKMLGSTHKGMTRSSSHQTSMYGSDFLELGWENGQILVKGGSSNRKPHNPSCNIGYSTINTSHKDEATGTTKRTRLNTLCSLLNDHFPPHKDSDLRSSHSHQTNDQNDLQFLQNNKSSNKLEEEFATIKQAKESMHEFLPSSPPLKKPRMDHASQAPEANSKKLKYLENCDQRRTAKVNNFSNFLVPKVILKSTQPIRNESLEKLEEIEEAAKGLKGLKGFQDQQTSVTANKSNDPGSLVVARSDEEPPLDDENSEAVAILRAKGKANSSLCNEPLLPSSPVWSLEASNDPNFSIRKHEDSDESTYSSRDVTYNDEEAEDLVVKETTAGEGSSVKRKRNVETRNLCEKKRRDKMNKKMGILKELIPNCNTVDRVSLLDDAIGYVKSLKLQLQIMSMGSGLCMQQMMLPQLMGAGMGFRPSTGINPWSPPQFPIPPLSSIKDNNTFQNMFGAFSNQMPHIPPIPHHHVPNFIPMMIGSNSSTQQLMPTTTPTNLPKHLANSSQLTTLDVSDLHAKAELCGTNHAENQAPLNHIPSYPFYFATQLE